MSIFNYIYIYIIKKKKCFYLIYVWVSIIYIQHCYKPHVNENYNESVISYNHIFSFSVRLCTHTKSFLNLFI